MASLLMLLMSGCTMKELSDVGIVRAVAIDGGDGIYEVTAKVMAKDGYEYVSAEGATIDTILSRMGNDPYLGQNELIVVSKDAKRVKAPLEALYRSSRTGGGEKVVWCEGSAPEYIASGRGSIASDIPVTDLRVFMNSMESVGRAVIVPFGKKTAPEADEAAIITDYCFDKVMDESELFGTRIMTDAAGGLTFDEEVLGDETGITVEDCSAQVSVDREDGKTAFDIGIIYTFSADSAGSSRDFRSGMPAKILKERTDAMMESFVRSAVSSCQESNGDVLNLATQCARFGAAPVKRGEWLLSNMIFRIDADGQRKFDLSERAFG